MESDSEQLREEPNHKAAGDPGEAAYDRWQSYVDQVLMPVAIRPAAEGDAPQIAVIADDGKVSRLLQLTEHGEDALELDATDLVGLNLSKEIFVSIEWLYQFKNAFLLGIESYKALVLAHLVLLLVTAAALVAAYRA